MPSGEQFVSTTATIGISKTIGFRDRDIFFANVDDEKHVGQTVHVLDAGEVLHQAFVLAVEFETLFFRQHLETAVFSHRFDVFQFLDRFLNGLIVGQQVRRASDC